MIDIRPLTPNDAQAYRKLRLTALEKAGNLLYGNIEEEKLKTLSQWKEAAKETTEHVILGAFYKTKLVGIMGARRWEGDSCGKTARFHGLFIDARCRGKMVGDQLYDGLYAWCEKNGYTKVVYTVRADNPCSMHLSFKHGATLTGEDVPTMRFADGSIGRSVWFTKNLG